MSKKNKKNKNKRVSKKVKNNTKAKSVNKSKVTTGKVTTGKVTTNTEKSKTSNNLSKINYEKSVSNIGSSLFSKNLNLSEDISKNNKRYSQNELDIKKDIIKISVFFVLTIITLVILKHYEFDILEYFGLI